MSITGSIIIYVIIWWVIFFCTLPFGIVSKNENFQESVRGEDAGAPKNPKIVKKFLITTIITTLLFLIIYILVNFNYLNLREYLN